MKYLKLFEEINSIDSEYHTDMIKDIIQSIIDDYNIYKINNVSVEMNSVLSSNQKSNWYYLDNEPYPYVFISFYLNPKESDKIISDILNSAKRLEKIGYVVSYSNIFGRWDELQKVKWSEMAYAFLKRRLSKHKEKEQFYLKIKYPR